MTPSVTRKDLLTAIIDSDKSISTVQIKESHSISWLSAIQPDGRASDGPMG
jgi:hypothetical protein